MIARSSSLFTSSRYSFRGHTIKKTAPLGGRQARRDFYDKDEKRDRSVYLSTVSEWEKESELDSSDHGQHAILNELRGPCLTALVDDVATDSDISNGQEAVSEDCSRRAALQTEDDTEIDPLPMLDLLLDQQDSSSQYFTRKYVGGTVDNVLGNLARNDASLQLLRNFQRLQPASMRLETEYQCDEVAEKSRQTQGLALGLPVV
ncbi:hypothetical protein BDU57DRAFT_528370 [Ampelomyces quisqualis]|uniref:Uncharacterized protein n=1 Tax=Ampelomyces quisqualis TaxID=50730 RepID=A0A6A5QQ22_AMPQU|nr:hypothetical protein BDU57DRAFT_528370 [Ampelomyces quisqualis]